MTRSWGVGRSGRSGRELFLARNAERVVRAARPDAPDERVAELAVWVTDEAVCSDMNPQSMRMYDIDAALTALVEVVEARFRSAA